MGLSLFAGDLKKNQGLDETNISMKVKPKRKGVSMSEEEKKFLEIVDLKKGFGSGQTRQEVLRGMNFSVAKGEFCVLLGPSGSGKSTLLNIIGGIDNALDIDDLLHTLELYEHRYKLPNQLSGGQQLNGLQRKTKMPKSLT